MRTLFALLLFAVPAVAAPVPKVEKKNAPPDRHWYMTRFNNLNKELSVEDMARNWVIEGEKMLLGATKITDQPGTVIDNHLVKATTLTVPDSSKPQLCKWGKYPAVIEVDGDTMRFCYIGDEKAELTECKPGPRIGYYEFKRVKVDK